MSTAYRPDIDGLRALAIVSVVAYHAGLPVPGGFTGVDVFFVISGFLITQLLFRELELRGSISITGFYARRARRLLPALTLVLTVTLVAGAALLPPFGEKAALGKSAIAAATFFANEFFRLSTGGYFDDPAALVPLLHTWSLSVEEQFYLIWPWVLILLAIVIAPASRRRAAIFTVAAGSIASFALCVWLTRRDSDHAFYFIGARAWELGAGALLALLDPRPGRWPASAGVVAAVAGAVLMTAGFFGLGSETPFPGFAALLPVAGTALLILGTALAPAAPPARWLASRPMVTLGLLSYSWYLWHWPVLSLARHQRLGERDVGADTVLALATLGLAWITYRFVENPIRYGSLSRSPALRTLAAGGAAIGAAAGLAAGLWLFAELRPPAPEVQRAIAIAGDLPLPNHRCAVPPHRWKAGPVPAAGCIHGTPPVRLAIWGDSQAAAWAAMLDGSSGYAQLTLNACPPLHGLTPRVPGVRGMGNCRPFNEAALRFLQQAAGQELRGVVLAARWTGYAGVTSIPVRDRRVAFADATNRTPQDALASLRTGIAATLAALRASGLRVAILLGAPEFPHPTYRCLLLRPAAECGIARATLEDFRRAVKDTIVATVAGFDDVRVIDPVAAFCDDRQCPAVRDGAAVLRDDNHVTATTARAFGRAIAHDFEWLAAPRPRAPPD